MLSAIYLFVVVITERNVVFIGIREREREPECEKSSLRGPERKTGKSRETENKTQCPPKILEQDIKAPAPDTETESAKM